MKNCFTVILFFFFSLIVFGQQKVPQEHKIANNMLTCSGLNGSVFQYLQDPRTPDQLFTLIFRCSNDTVKGTMLGPDPEGDEGLYFFKSELDSITLKGNKITFSSVQGDMYNKPFTLENYQKPIVEQKSGASIYRYMYKGYLHSDTLTFICTMKYYGCYADTMDFIKHRIIK